MLYEFDWDPRKAHSNLRKHGVSFRLAMSAFRDPLALTLFDTDHSDDEERWITLGRASNDQLLVVVHTCQPSSSAHLHIRIISARRANPDEVRDYEQPPH